jgi:hypothetical protein
MNDWLSRDLSDTHDTGDDDHPLIHDELLDQMARLELAQRFLWAMEVGVDPLRGDLLALASAPRGSVRQAA